MPSSANHSIPVNGELESVHIRIGGDKLHGQIIANWLTESLKLEAQRIPIALEEPLAEVTVLDLEPDARVVDERGLRPFATAPVLVPD